MGTLTTYTLLERGFDHYDPGGLAANSPAVISLHPSISNPSAWRTNSSLLNSTLDTRADEGGFHVFYPYGTDRAGLNLRTWNAGWCCGYANDTKRNDVLFLKQMIQKIVDDFDVDPTRIYLNGFSNGAMLALTYLSLYPEEIAGAVMAASALVRDVDELAPLIELPITWVHGSLDAVVPPAGGYGSFGAQYLFGSVQSAIDILTARGASVEYISLVGSSHTFASTQAYLASQEGTDFARLMSNMVAGG